MKLTWVDERSAEGRLRAFWTPSIYMTLNKIEDASANSYLTTLHSRMTSVSENCLYTRLKSSGVRLPSKRETISLSLSQNAGLQFVHNRHHGREDGSKFSAIEGSTGNETYWITCTTTRWVARVG